MDPKNSPPKQTSPSNSPPQTTATQAAPKSIFKKKATPSTTVKVSTIHFNQQCSLFDLYTHFNNKTPFECFFIHPKTNQHHKLTITKFEPSGFTFRDSQPALKGGKFTVETSKKTLFYLAKEAPKAPRHKCTCDFYKVILVSGCKCGGE